MFFRKAVCLHADNMRQTMHLSCINTNRIDNSRQSADYLPYICTKMILRVTVLLQKAIAFQMFPIRLILVKCSLMKNIGDNA